MEQEYRVETAEDPQHVVETLEEKLYEHNSQKIDRNDGHLFSKAVRDQRGTMIAGIAGWTWAGACEITQFWVSEDVRGKGIGKKLLEAAENEARGSRCTIILVRTYSFQAPAFYEKHGYGVKHVVEGFPPGHRYYILAKVL